MVIYDDGVKIYEKEVKTGTPQGSTASLIIWNIGANDLLDNLEDKKIDSVMFGDDQMGVLFSDNAQILKKRINEYFRIIFNWCFSTGFDLNANKCQIMNIDKQAYTDVIEYNGKEIQFVDHVKYLAIYLDNRLKSSN